MLTSPLETAVQIYISNDYTGIDEELYIFSDIFGGENWYSSQFDYVVKEKTKGLDSLDYL